jgi:hypothetical protein
MDKKNSGKNFWKIWFFIYPGILAWGKFEGKSYPHPTKKGSSKVNLTPIQLKRGGLFFTLQIKTFSTYL